MQSNPVKKQSFLLKEICKLFYDHVLNIIGFFHGIRLHFTDITGSAKDGVSQGWSQMLPPRLVHPKGPSLEKPVKSVKCSQIQ